MRTPPFPPAPRDYRSAQEVAAANIVAAETPLQPGDERVKLRMEILVALVSSPNLMAKLNPHDLADLMGTIEAQVTRRT